MENTWARLAGCHGGTPDGLARDPFRPIALDARVDSGMLEQFRQLGDVRRDAPGLLAGER
jgi:hypothetical protein